MVEEVELVVELVVEVVVKHFDHNESSTTLFYIHPSIVSVVL